MRTVLVTGANGFVGRHLCRTLASRGVKVIAAVRSAAAPELAGIAEARTVGDLAAPRALDAALLGADAVVHLAARVHVMRDAAVDPLAEHRRVNTATTLELARAAIRRGIRRFVFLSTIKVNGERTGAAPFTERDAPAPADPYGISKWEAEQGLAALAACGALELVVLRPPLVYGPGVEGNFLRLMKLVDWRVPLPLAGVANRRSLIYVGNLVSAVECAACAEPATCGTFLVSDGVDLSTAELVRRLGVAMGRPARLFALPPVLLAALGRALGKSDEVKRMIESLRLECAAIRQQLQWTAPFTVEQGLKDTADWFACSRAE